MGKVIDNFQGSPLSVAAYMAKHNICIRAANCVKDTHPEDKYACQGCIMNYLVQEDKEATICL